MKREGTMLGSFQLVEQPQDKQRLLKVNEDVNSFIECTSKELVLRRAAFIGVFYRRNAFSVVQGFIKWALLYPFAIILTEIIDFLSESAKRVLFQSILSSLLFLLFLLSFLLLLCLLLSLFLFLLLIFFYLIYVLFQVSQNPACSFCVFFIIINIIVELNQFCILS